MSPVLSGQRIFISKRILNESQSLAAPFLSDTDFPEVVGHTMKRKTFELVYRFLSRVAKTCRKSLIYGIRYYFPNELTNWSILHRILRLSILQEKIVLQISVL